MKGQFMLIASIVIGFIVISAATTISEVQRTEFESEDMTATVEMVKEEAGKIDHSDESEIQNFRSMVSMISGYQTEVSHWDLKSCFNVTISSPDRTARLSCI